MDKNILTTDSFLQFIFVLILSGNEEGSLPWFS